MTRKTKEETTKAGKTKKPSKEHKKIPESKEAEETNPMDFGGIPNRNLKKNLGCG